jgi:two-component sensor histidine kinase
VPAGRVSVFWRIEDDELAEAQLRLRWLEVGGPPVPGPPARRGFGTRVLEATLRYQLGGTVTLAWETTGLACEIVVPLRHAQIADRAPLAGVEP